MYLRVEPAELFRRVQRSGFAPFLDPVEPERDFLSLCREREPRYLERADLIIDLNCLDIDMAFEKLARRIEEL